MAREVFNREFASHRSDRSKLTDQPHLIFPGPTRTDRSQRGGSALPPNPPPSGQQATRLAPQFAQLQIAMDQRQASLQDNPIGIAPEKVLVLETFGPINNFINAVQHVAGFEWLGDLDRTFELDYGFDPRSDDTATMDGRLFLVMTNNTALRQLQGLFELWQTDDSSDFPPNLAPLKQAFRYLRNIRPWNAQDRVNETNLLQDWEFLLDHDHTQEVSFEIELWFRTNPEQRRLSSAQLVYLIDEYGGTFVREYVVEEIRYHGVLASISRQGAQNILNHSDDLEAVKLLAADEIMFVFPTGRFGIKMRDDETPKELDRDYENYPSINEPLVALFDGLPLTTHKTIDNRIFVDDPDDFENAYQQASDRQHGTMMSSLICHGDLSTHDIPIDRQLYVRPILKPSVTLDGSEELVPENELPIDLIHRSVRRLFEGDGDQPPVAPSVRVVNLSICYKNRQFANTVSSYAKILDWLAYKYNVLFLVSAGNYWDDITTETHVNGQIVLLDRLGERVIQSLSQDTRNRRLLSPSEQINGLTIGAAHHDESKPSIGNLVDPFTNHLFPSVFNAHGPGFKRGIKPDIMVSGGRQFLRESVVNPAVLEQLPSYNPPGQKAAIPGQAGHLNDWCFSRGTSNATALASRTVHFIYNVIESLRALSDGLPPMEYDALLIKTLLTHSSSWGKAYDTYESVLKPKVSGYAIKNYVARFLGNGFIDLGRVVGSTEQRVTVLGYGALEDGEADEFRLPLPPSLASVSENRRLTITLGWFTPINSANQRYRVAHLWFDPKSDNVIARTRINGDHNAVQRGTLQHEVLEDEAAVPFQDGKEVVIKVNCRADAGPIDQPIKYALAVTLEVGDGINLPIYQEIRDRLPIRVQPRV